MHCCHCQTMRRIHYCSCLLLLLWVAEGFVVVPTIITTSVLKKAPPAVVLHDATSNHPAAQAGAAWEHWCIQQMEERYRQALAFKCPFLRRRVTDLLDHVDYVLRNVVLPDPSIMGPPLAYSCESEDSINNDGTCKKRFGLSIHSLAEVLWQDWRTATHKGYYITGKLNTDIYRDDCLFDGPDPDMPVRGLRKYLNAASQLFCPAKSTCELLSLQVLEERGFVEAKWRMQGRLRLPWKPWIPVVTGTTRYYTDSTGLIFRHEETWDISVAQAFLQTLWPEMGRILWKNFESSEQSERIQC